MSQVDMGALGERLEIKITDSQTGKVRRHLIQIDGEWIDLADPKTQRLLKIALVNYILSGTE